jgi:hypothetical protein
VRRIELTSIALELDAADPRIVVLQPIVREPETRPHRGLLQTARAIADRQAKREMRARLRAATR